MLLLIPFDSILNSYQMVVLALPRTKPSLGKWVWKGLSGACKAGPTFKR